MISSKKGLVTAVITLLITASVSSSTIAEELLLVGASSSSRQPFTIYELRKIFLGHSVEREGAQVKGVVNTADEEVYQIFLQKLIHLSAKDYERRLMSRMFRTGVSSVSKVDTFAELKSALLSDDSNISVVRAGQLAANSNLEVIQVLWVTGQ